VLRIFFGPMPAPEVWTLIAK